MLTGKDIASQQRYYEYIFYFLFDFHVFWFQLTITSYKTSDRGRYCKKKKHYAKIFNAYLSSEATI